MVRPSRRQFSRTERPSSVGKPQIEYHRIIWFRVAEKVAVFAVARAVDNIACLFKGSHELTVQICIIFDYENAHIGQLLE